MKSRTELQTLLESFDVSKVYYQPPESVKLVYPCIVYSRSSIDVKFASDRPYKYKKAYKLTLIYRDPDSSIPDEMFKLPLCRFERHFTVDNLNHDIFNIYY